MFGVLIGALISTVIMYICRWVNLISDQWDWYFFFSGIIIYGRITIYAHNCSFSAEMKKMLESSWGNYYFNEDEKLLLRVSAGQLIPTLKFDFECLRLEAASLTTFINYMSAILFVVALIQDRYIVAFISMYSCLTYPKFWDINPFYFTKDSMLRNATIVKLYLKAKGKNIKNMSEVEIKDYADFVLNTLSNFDFNYRVYQFGEKYNLL